MLLNKTEGLRPIQPGRPVLSFKIDSGTVKDGVIEARGSIDIGDPLTKIGNHEEHAWNGELLIIPGRPRVWDIKREDGTFGSVGFSALVIMYIASELELYLTVNPTLKKKRTSKPRYWPAKRPVGRPRTNVPLRMLSHPLAVQAIPVRENHIGFTNWQGDCVCERLEESSCRLPFEHDHRCFRCSCGQKWWSSRPTDRVWVKVADDAAWLILMNGNGRPTPSLGYVGLEVMLEDTARNVGLEEFQFHHEDRV